MRINQDIRVTSVRFVGPEGEQCGIVKTEEALRICRNSSLDLVEVSPNAEPPVCKAIDYGRYLFQQRKDVKKQQKKVKVKEIKFRPVTDVGDYNIKLKRIREFIEAGHKVRIVMRFRFRRELTSKELGSEMLSRLIEQLSDIAQVDAMPKHEGRQMVMIVSPKGK
jgi:translation initiation factor IF-3